MGTMSEETVAGRKPNGRDGQTMRISGEHFRKSRGVRSRGRHLVCTKACKGPDCVCLRSGNPETVCGRVMGSYVF